ncbi:MAG: hypothetical protein EOP38_00350 [Rubrivivax sp.]|nr:MAG: hypothetical protein EOP38_00350 [Rubrivivax sp.]
MADEKSNVVELLKYPIIIFSILLALVASRYLLGITFGQVAEVTANGVKFSQDAKGEIAALAAQVNSATAAIEELRKQSGQHEALSPKAQSDIFEASQTVSNQTAQVAKLPSDQGVDSQKSRGYIWIGDYKGAWTRVKLAPVNANEPITYGPGQILPGSDFKVLGNMVVREGLPPNNVDYYQSRKSLGIIPAGSKVRILSAPTGIDREFAVQYWAEVAVQ